MKGNLSAPEGLGKPQHDYGRSFGDKLSQLGATAGVGAMAWLVRREARRQEEQDEWDQQELDNHVANPDRPYIDNLEFEAHIANQDARLAQGRARRREL